uniref:RUN and SH3 domain containing 1 n=1 Tax=Ailuropoda melanoleuca TaxID=9646 RepID=A0A7N5P605_AILME
MAEAQSGTGQLQEQKKGLLIAVSASVDKIISHFGAARNLVQKAQLGDSRLSPDVGHLVLTTLCPALHALVADGLKPFRKDLITGQRRSSPWSVVEASVKPGPSVRSVTTPRQDQISSASGAGRCCESSPLWTRTGSAVGRMAQRGWCPWGTHLSSSSPSTCRVASPSGALGMERPQGHGPVHTDRSRSVCPVCKMTLPPRPSLQMGNQLFLFPSRAICKVKPALLQNV